jgi:NADPH:quinone reductase-like Zn-dependent oxidoreductase
VHWGAAGVTGFAIQLARYIGARGITTASVGKYDHVRSPGADDVIESRHPRDKRGVRGALSSAPAALRKSRHGFLSRIRPAASRLYAAIALGGDAHTH